MIGWLIFLGGIYICLLVFASWKAKNEVNLSDSDDLIQKTQVNVFLGVLTYSATLFSTFTLMGMPNFFRTHGIGAWIFLGVTDVAMAFILITCGRVIYKNFKKENVFSVSHYLQRKYNSKFPTRVFLLGIFIFLVPYTAIQIKGISSFLEISMPFELSETIWSLIILSIVLFYSYFGGFKAIVYSDAIQGVILLILVWIIGINCIEMVGGVEEMFLKVKDKNIALLSVPGPKNLFSFQFLLASFIAIVLMPITQPQLTTRLITMKDLKSLNMMAPAIAFFAILVILPTVLMGMYGAIEYEALSAKEFWYNILIKDQSPVIGALSLLGLVAAAMSTTDSQLFSLGHEASFFIKKDKNYLKKSKFLIIVFAVASLVFSVLSKSELVLLARLSFAGTAILAPMLINAFFPPKNRELSNLIPIFTFLGILVFLCSSLMSSFPKAILSIRIDLIIYSILFFILILERTLLNKRS